MPLEFDHPVMKGFNFKGGMVIRPEFLGMLFGLSIYTAAFISETVRSGIISVSKGQREAAQAIGLKANFIMRLIIIPQALRVIIPPLYLSISKSYQKFIFRNCYWVCRFSSWIWRYFFKPNGKSNRNNAYCYVYISNYKSNNFFFYEFI